MPHTREEKTKTRRLMQAGGMVLISLLGVACSGGTSGHAASSGGDVAKVAAQPTSKPDHVWKGQVQALEKAKGVEGTIMDAAKQQGREMERQSLYLAYARAVRTGSLRYSPSIDARLP